MTQAHRVGSRKVVRKGGDVQGGQEASLKGLNLPRALDVKKLRLLKA